MIDNRGHERMIDFAQTVLNLPEREQDKIFEFLAASGVLTYEQAHGLKEYVAWYHLFGDRDYYEEAKKAVCGRISNEIFGQEGAAR